MTENERKDIIEALEQFVIRVSKGLNASNKETEILPEIAHLLILDV